MSSSADEDVSQRAAQAVSAEGIAAFHHAFGGSNAIHVDPEAAKAHGGLVQHGMRTLFPVFALLARERLSAGARRMRIDAKFLAPVRAGDALEASIALESNEGGQATFEVAATNGAGSKVMAGRATLTGR